MISPRHWPSDPSIRFARDQLASQSVQHSFFRRFDTARMDIERGPVVNDIVLRRRHRDDAHFRMFTQQVVTDAWSFPRAVERDDHKIWESLLHTLDDFRIVNDLTDNFNVGLVCEG